MTEFDPEEYQISDPVAYKDEKILQRLYHEEGLTLRQTARVLDVSDTTVFRWMEKHGIEMRTKSEAQGGGVSFRFSKRGYPTLSVSHGTSTSQVRVHSLVAIAAGASPAKVFSNGEYHVHHLNGVPWDNRPGNLAVITSGDHIRSHGTPEESHAPYEREPDGTFAPGGGAP